jgi:cyclopropane-fatty-acyl-phospholipid synthase
MIEQSSIHRRQERAVCREIRNVCYANSRIVITFPHAHLGRILLSQRSRAKPIAAREENMAKTAKLNADVRVRPLRIQQRPSPNAPSKRWVCHFDPKSRVRQLLASADIYVNGHRPWDLVVHDERFYSRVLHGGSVGLGDSYLDGWWDCQDLDGFFCRILQNGLASHGWPLWRRLPAVVAGLLVNSQSTSRSRRVAEKHYDLGNKLYQSMLDSRLVYTSAYWHSKSTLDEAQEQKLRIVCEALGLQPGMRLLDIGCGWGSLAKFAAQNFGAVVVGVTISEEQCGFARDSCAGLPVTILLRDYRDVSGKFDRLASLGMFEHVGERNYKLFFSLAHEFLEPTGLFYLSTIGSFQSNHYDDPWFLKHIFPNSHIPSWQQLFRPMTSLFSIRRLQDWSEDYGKTVFAWFSNFERNWQQLRTSYDVRFHRMWHYYLLAAAATFQTGRSTCRQLLLAPK